MDNFNKIIQCASCGHTKEWTSSYQQAVPDCECGNDTWIVSKKDCSIKPIPPGSEHTFWSNPRKYKLPKYLEHLAE